MPEKSEAISAMVCGMGWGKVLPCLATHSSELGSPRLRAGLCWRHLAPATLPTQEWASERHSLLPSLHSFLVRVWLQTCTV